MSDDARAARTASSDAMARVAPGTWLCAVCIGLTLAVGFPGHLGIDSRQQLEAALAGSFYAWHPPAMAAVWMFANALVKGPFLMLLLQVTAWWLGLAWIARSLFPGRRAWQLAFFLGVGLFPPCFGHVTHISKDAQMMSALVLGVGVLVRFERNEHPWPLWAALAALLYGSAVRYNGTAAVLPFVLWIPLCLSKGPLAAFDPPLRRRVVLASGVVLLAGSFAINAVLLPADAGETPMTQTVAYDLMGLSARTDRDLLPAIDGAPQRTAAEYDAVYARGWTKYFAKPENRIALGAAHAERFREAWREAILSHPLAYLAHRWHTFAIATGFTDLAGFYVTIPWDWTRVELHYPRHGLEVSWERSGFSLLVRSWLGAAVENLPGLFRSWRYLLLAGIGLVVCATRGARGRGWPVRSMLLLSSACLYSGTYFFAGGQTNLRFHLWSVTAVVLAAAFLVHELRAHPAGERDA